MELRSNNRQMPAIIRNERDTRELCAQDTNQSDQKETQRASERKKKIGNRLPLKWRFYRIGFIGRRCIISCWCFVSIAPNQLWYIDVHIIQFIFETLLEIWTPRTIFTKTIAIHKEKHNWSKLLRLTSFFFVLRVFIVLSSIWLLIVCTSMYIWKIFVNWRLYCNLKFHAKKNYCFFSQFLSIFWC